MKEDVRSRLTDSVESACKLSDGNLVIFLPDAPEGENELEFSQNYACREHGISLGELEPRMFSFNSPFGACPDCDGLGQTLVLSPDKLMPDKSLSLREGACICNGYKSMDKRGWTGNLFDQALADFGFGISTLFTGSG